MGFTCKGDFLCLATLAVLRCGWQGQSVVWSYHRVGQNWMGIALYAEISGLQRMNRNDFGDSLTFFCKLKFVGFFVKAPP